MAVVKTYVVPRHVSPRLDLNKQVLETDRAKKAVKIYLYRAQLILPRLPKRNQPL
jgi:hypothetical protein